ncbi:hypothetical protein FH972_024265 [Carpinus fangiana]|uniref:C3H1-type domain-containing protein n=1 Tax=Carpinus fangiana TaxID=176857 RepID=A0A5N6L026_9ROSI|nr:hypothetical protein FH972_024265 [Carpinus fangiana]
MADNLELQHKIARLAGRINRHKNQQVGQANPPTTKPHGQYGFTDKNEYADMVGHSAYTHGGQQWAPTRGTPYGSPRGRGYGHRPATFKNRTLVINNQAGSESTPRSTPSTGEAPTGWVTKRDRHMQLINTTVYDQKVQERTQAMAETRKQKQLQRDELQKARTTDQLRVIGTQQTNQQFADGELPSHIFAEGIKFEVVAGGSKLIKDKATMAISTDPDWSRRCGQTAILWHSLVSVLTKTLVLVPEEHQQQNNSVRLLAIWVNGILLATFLQHTNVCNPKESLLTASDLGTCPKGPLCRFAHDCQKLALCREYMQGKCSAGEDCNLSHELTPERVPFCVHFMRGNCTNEDCKYPHVRVNPGAPVCKDFAILGYCPEGAACDKRHVRECPSYANKGLCHNKHCRLPHVDNASRLRRQAKRGQSPKSEDSRSDITSDGSLDDADSDDVDSDGFDDILMHEDKGRQLSQQQDFVSL